MSKQCLDVQQMKHLQELGMDTSNASMCWLKTPNGMGLTFNDEWINLDKSILDPIPAYTLQDVLDALPKEIMCGCKSGYKIYWLSIDLADEKIEYYNENAIDKRHSVHFEFYSSSSLIDAAYELLVWCIEQGYVGTNKNK